MRPVILLFGVVVASTVLHGAAAAYEETLDGPGWVSLTLSNYGTHASIISFATNNGAIAGVVAFNDAGEVLARHYTSGADSEDHSVAFGFPAAGVALEVDHRGPPTAQVAGAGVEVGAHARVHAIAWAASDKDDIRRQIRISTQGSDPTIVFHERRTGALWLTAADTQQGAAAQLFVAPAEVAVAAGYTRSVHVTGHLVGLAGVSLAPQPMKATLTSSDSTRECPCFMDSGAHATPAGDYAFEWTGAFVNLAIPIFAAVDVPTLPYDE